jgi:hypothetical protein
MRAAIEDAIAAREPADAGELVERLRSIGDQAADPIEELVSTLRKYADDEYNGYNKDGEHARAVLTRMGVKL